MTHRLSPDSTRRSIRARVTPKRKPSFRPTLEGLESRLVLSTITWSGAGNGTTFSSGANWNGGVAPGSGDDAQITISGFSDIQLPAAGITLHSLSVATGDTLDLSAGTLTTTTGLSLSGEAILNVSGGSVAGTSTLNLATLNFSGGSISATLSSSTLNYLNSISSSDSFLMLGTDSVSGPISSSQTLTVQTNSTNSDANLELSAGTTNAGSINFQSTLGTTGVTYLNVTSGTTFVNTGTIGVGASSEAVQIINGDFDNQGTINIASGGTLQFNAIGFTFTQDTGGTLNAVGDFYSSNSILVVNGGNVSGNVYSDGGYLQIASTITSPTTVYLTGYGSNLIGNDSTLGTVWVQSNGAETDLDLASGVVNLGTIVLQGVAAPPGALAPSTSPAARPSSTRARSTSATAARATRLPAATSTTKAPSASPAAPRCNSTPSGGPSPRTRAALSTPSEISTPAAP